MSDDIQTESVMKATIHGACDFVMKPIKNDVIATIWQHCVRKKMLFKTYINDLLQDSDWLLSADFDETDNIDEKAAKKPQLSSAGNIELVQSDIVQTEGSSQDNIIQNNGKNVGKKTRKPRMTWTEDLKQKFVAAIKMVGGIEKANPRLIHHFLQEKMMVRGLTISNVASRLQKHRIHHKESKSHQPTQEISGCSTSYGAIPSIRGTNNVQTDTSTYLMVGHQAVNAIQQNQNQNGYMPTNNNQFIPNRQPMNNNQFIPNRQPMNNNQFIPFRRHFD